MILKTLNATAGNGYVITLVPPGSSANTFVPTKVKITSSAGCSIKLIPFAPDNLTVPTAPGADPAPTSGNQSDWYRLIANETAEIGVQRGTLQADPFKYGQFDYFQYALVWAEANANIRVIAS